MVLIFLRIKGDVYLHFHTIFSCVVAFIYGIVLYIILQYVYPIWAGFMNSVMANIINLNNFTNYYFAAVEIDHVTARPARPSCVANLHFQTSNPTL